SCHFSGRRFSTAASYTATAALAIIWNVCRAQLPRADRLADPPAAGGRPGDAPARRGRTPPYEGTPLADTREPPSLDTPAALRPTLAARSGGSRPPTASGVPHSATPRVVQPRSGTPPLPIGSGFLN